MFSIEFSFTDIFQRYWLQSSFIKEKFLWLLSIYMDVASYCCYEKGSWTNARSLSIFILFQLQNWIILRVRRKFLLRNFHAKRVIFEMIFAMGNTFNKCIASSLSNNYFPLNESSSLYQQCFVYSITARKNTYLKNYFKTFNALILTPYSYPKQTTYCA